MDDIWVLRKDARVRKLHYCTFFDFTKPKSEEIIDDEDAHIKGSKLPETNWDKLRAAAAILEEIEIIEIEYTFQCMSRAIAIVKVCME